jgi:hypothetical protein
MSHQEQWSYSRCGESYSGGFTSWREAALEAFHGTDDSSVWVGRCEPPIDPESFIDADFLIEHIQVQDEYNHEWAEGWPGATQEQEDELTDAVRAVLAEWLDRHGLRPRFYTIPHGFQVTPEQAEDPTFDPFDPART